MQTKLGKSIPAVPNSSANAIVYIELGWKLIRLQIEVAKLRFLSRVEDQDFKGSNLVKTSMDWNKNTELLYWRNLEAILGKHTDEENGIGAISEKQLHVFHQLEIQNLVQNLASLRLTQLPHKWWKPIKFLCNSRCSNIMTRFKCMNVGLGNRDAYRAADAVAETGG